MTTAVTETAIAAALNKMVTRRLQNRRAETNASVAASSTAASPPYRSKVKKINVSETEMCELRRGIGIVTRDASPIVSAASIKKLISTADAGSRNTASPTHM